MNINGTKMAVETIPQRGRGGELKSDVFHVLQEPL
jgi:hypothetical protein